VKAEGFDWRELVAYLIAAIIVVGFLATQWYVLGHPIADSARDIVLRTLGTLDALLVMVAQYLFGSSRGSRAKDRILAEMTPPARSGGEGS